MLVERSVGVKTLSVDEFGGSSIKELMWMVPNEIGMLLRLAEFYSLSVAEIPKTLCRLG